MRSRDATTKGFKRTASLLAGRIRSASESRGFAETKLLTQWPDIAGPDIAGIARPVEVTFGRGGFGATLTLLTTGANAPMLEMQKESLRNKVNAVYGYNAISRVRITQTAATGFSEGRVSFNHKPVPKPAEAPTPVPAAHKMAAPVEDDGLRLALERLGSNIMNKDNQRTN